MNVNLVGMTTEQARNVTLQKGQEFRVVQEDGEDFFVTQDYRTNRLNVAVTNGRVSCVKGYY